MKRFILFVCLTAVRVFFRRIEARGVEKLPDGPLLVTANHPNGLMDPVVVRVALGREFGFLAKSTLFENPVGKTTMEAFGALPVYRSSDGNDTSKNDSMFDACRDRFAEGRSIVMFPEGTSHSDPMMKRLKTGAARIALSTQAQGTDVHIVPVGLFYEAKDTFRSRVAVEVGDAIPMSDFMSEYADEEFETAKRVTSLIAENLSEVVLQADSVELWQTLVSVAQWTNQDAKDDIAAAHDRAQVLAAAYRQMSETNPARANEIAEDVLHLNRMLKSLGVEQPLEIHRATPTLGRILATAAPLIVFAPFAVVGVISGWVPYRLFGPASRRIAGRHLDLVSTIKAIMGLVLMPLVYAAEALLIAYYTDWQTAVVAGLSFPVCGLIAVRYGEWLEMRRTSFKVRWLKLTRASAATQIAERREALSKEIESALSEVEVDL